MESTTRLVVSLMALTLLACAPDLAAQSTPAFKVIHGFDYIEDTDGNAPNAALIQGSNGNLYGTTSSGGTNFDGTIFQVSLSGVLTLLHSFGGGSDGQDPYGALVLDSAGNFYGTTYYGGGSSGDGTVFTMSPGGTLTTLHNFSALDASGNNADGAHTYAGLVLGNDGSFYGTMPEGGISGGGTVFKITPAGKLTTLYDFAGGINRGEPNAALVLGRDGNFYGTTYGGGAGSGGVFKITPEGVFTALHNFSVTDEEDANKDGALPDSALTQGSDDRFYGTTVSGGKNGTGVVFKISTKGDFTTLHSFGALGDDNSDNADGANLAAGLIEASDGNFYGVATDGGRYASGTVFKITPAGVFTTLHSFSHDIDGAFPDAPLLQASDGNFYGTANAGGPRGGGTVFEIQVTPSIMSPATATATIGHPFSYQVVATNGPTQFGFQGNTNGLTINPSTGVISGTPKAAGSFTYTLNAYNGFGKGSAPLKVTVNVPAPVITSATTATAIQGSTFSYQITATGNPTSYGVQGLPAGITLSATTGLITGTPKGAGKATLTLNAYNTAGKGSASLILTIAAAPPVITSATTATATVGKAFSYQITATNQPTTFGVQGLPSGLAVDSKTGLISSTPKAAGKFTLTLNAYNSAGRGSASLTLTVAAK